MKTYTSIDQAVQDLFGGPKTELLGQNAGETGVDVGLPAGHYVGAVQAGTYRSDLSTSHQVVIQTPSGLLENYVHINPVLFKSGQHIKLHQYIGSIYGGEGVYANAKTHAPGTYPGTYPFPSAHPSGSFPYFSTGPHLEFDVAQVGAIANPWDFFTAGKTVSPVPLLTGLPGASNPSFYHQISLPSAAIVAGTNPGTPSVPFITGVENAVGTVGSAIGGTASNIGSTASNIGNIPAALGSVAGAITQGTQTALKITAAIIIVVGVVLIVQTVRGR